MTTNIKSLIVLILSRITTNKLLVVISDNIRMISDKQISSDS
jgi:hypothetical protein